MLVRWSTSTDLESWGRTSSPRRPFSRLTTVRSCPICRERTERQTWPGLDLLGLATPSPSSCARTQYSDLHLIAELIEAHITGEPLATQIGRPEVDLISELMLDSSSDSSAVHTEPLDLEA